MFLSFISNTAFLSQLVSISTGVRRESKVSGWKNTERASPKKTLRLRQQGMKFHNLPNCLGNMEMNMWNLSLQNQPIVKQVVHLSCSVLRDKMGKIMITDLPNELLLKVADDLSYISLIKENWELWRLKISWFSNFLHWTSKVFSWLTQTELGAVMLVCKRWAQV